MKILVLAAGHVPAQMKDGEFPLSLTEFDGTPLIEIIARKIADLKASQYIFLFPEKEVQRYHLDNIARLLLEQSLVLQVKDMTRGAACTALLAIDHINTSEELLVISANELVDVDIGAILEDFRRRQLDAGTITFHSIHPRYSYVKTDHTDLVIEAAQRNPISQRATVGIFWFSRGSDFIHAAMEMIKKDAHIDGIFYICPALNELILKQQKIGVYDIDTRQYHPLKSERQITRFESSLEEGHAS